jgi:hypothetical protein
LLIVALARTSDARSLGNLSCWGSRILSVLLPVNRIRSHFALSLSYPYYAFAAFSFFQSICEIFSICAMCNL